MGRPGGLLLLSLLLVAQGGAGAGSCEPHASCEACVRSHPRCAWCEDPDFPRGGLPEAPRCASREALERAGCPPDAVVEPHSSVQVLRDEEGGQGGGTPTQLRPQSVRMLLRPGEERSFQARFRRAPGLPVDLYYLTDLSYSMRDDLASLRRLGSDLLGALRNVTPSVRIGFGSFVDKPVLPYASTVPWRLRNPCPGRGEPCAPPAAFRHVLPLTPDAGAFAAHVARQHVSANMDAPEGGFDAMLQVAVCQDRIGWRPGTRLLLVASDDTFHTAGDGKLGGIVTPSDTRCHLDASGVYTKSHLYDYPSVGHLAQVLSAANIQPIFAVTAPTLPVYQELSRLIPRSVVAELRDDSSNVVQLIADAYNSLSSTVELQHSPLPPGISITYESHCGDPPGTPPAPQLPRGFCTGVGVNQEVTFTVRVRAGACLGSPQRVVLRVLGFSEELSLELSTLCACPCAHRQPRTPLCHGGALDCGVCRCPAGRQGRRCECEGAAEAVGGCRPPNSTGPPCSGRGRCVCGACECPPGLSGTLCQCDSSACERHRGLPCGGPQRGECVCGRCRCRPGFGGRGCGCRLGGGGCLRGGRECGGHGRCVCGTCLCQPGYVGPLCAHCPSCRPRCQRLRDCADCGAFGRGPLGGNCSRACARISTRLLPPPPGPHAWCREKTQDGRILLFLIEGGGEEEEEEVGEATLTVWAEEGECEGTPGTPMPPPHPRGAVSPGTLCPGAPAPYRTPHWGGLSLHPWDPHAQGPHVPGGGCPCTNRTQWVGGVSCTHGTLRPEGGCPCTPGTLWDLVAEGVPRTPGTPWLGGGLIAPIGPRGWVGGVSPWLRGFPLPLPWLMGGAGGAQSVVVLGAALGGPGVLALLVLLVLLVLCRVRRPLLQRDHWDQNSPLFRSATTTAANPSYLPPEGTPGTS